MAIRKIISRSIGVDVITAEDLATNSITAAEISNGAVTENKIDAGAVTATKLASDSVTTAKIADSNITNAKLAADGFDAAKFTTGTLPIARIADGAVTAGKLASTLDLTGKTVTLPAGTGGKVLQVVTNVKSDVFSTAADSFTNISGFHIAITPTAAGTKMIGLVDMQCSNESSETWVQIRKTVGGVTTDIYKSTQPVSGSPQITGLIHLQGGGRSSVRTHFTFVDIATSTNEIIYNVAIRRGTNINTIWFNSNQDGVVNDSVKPVMASSHTVMEIAA